jgi:hypothetical protein
MRRHMKVHADPVRERSTTEDYESRPRERSGTIEVEGLPVRQAQSAKDDDEGVSEASEISPGGPLGVVRPRQGSRSSI